MRCLSCGFENPEGIKFCGECGTSLTAQPLAPSLQTLTPSPRTYTPPHLAERILAEQGQVEEGIAQIAPPKAIRGDDNVIYVEAGYRTEEETFLVGDRMAEVGADVVEETGVLVALAPFVVEEARQT